MTKLGERFWMKVRKTDGCWLWTASLNHYGYGQFRDGSTVSRAHRLAYVEANGSIPDGLQLDQLDHLCRNRACVNPDHLEPVTQRTNNRRGMGFSGRNAAKTACLNGHQFDAQNTHRDRIGRRRCRACHAARERARSRRRSA